MTSKFRLLALAAIFMLFWRPAPASAQAPQVPQGDTLEVHFRVGQSDLDLSFADNQKQVDQFVARVQKHFADAPDKSLKLEIFAGASPEGPAELNRRLGEQRGVALREVLMERLGYLLEEVTIVNQGARWGSLYALIQQSDEPWKDEVLDILAKQPESDEWKVDPREQKLRKLKGGSVWNKLAADYLTELRSSGSAVIAPVVNDRGRWAYRRDTLVILDTIIYAPEVCPCPVDPIDHSPVWALKTNFALLAAAAPNLQVEFPLGTTNRWSIEGEIFWPWWIWNHNANAHEFGNVGVEVRYWLGNREKHHTLDGFHVGLACAGGYYDTELKAHHGYQGEYLNLYLNLGYQYRFGLHKQWAVGAGVGLGWIPTNYREYLGSTLFPEGHTEEYDYHLMWQKTSSRSFFGATHAHISLAYMFHLRNNKR